MIYIFFQVGEPEYASNCSIYDIDYAPLVRGNTVALEHTLASILSRANASITTELGVAKKAVYICVCKISGSPDGYLLRSLTLLKYIAGGEGAIPRHLRRPVTLKAIDHE